MQKIAENFIADKWWRRQWHPALDHSLACLNRALAVPDDSAGERSILLNKSMDFAIEAAHSAGNGSESAIKELFPDRKQSSTQEILFSLLSFYDKPDHRLAAYGSLQPGESNYHLMNGIEGNWQHGELIGDVHKHDGYPRFCWQPGGASIKATVLESSNLKEHYPRLDYFEGRSYRRILVPVRVGQEWSVCNVYASCDQSYDF